MEYIYIYIYVCVCVCVCVCRCVCVKTDMFGFVFLAHLVISLFSYNVKFSAPHSYT